MRLIRQKIFIFILIIISSTSFADTRTGVRITDIIISGNTKTKDSVILSIIKARVGDIYAEGLEKDIEQLIFNSRMFHNIQVEIEKKTAGVILIIRLKDKWSLLPFPIVSLRSDESRYGIAIIESNLFGYHKQLLGGLLYENDRFSQALMYNDRNFLNSNYRLLFVLRNMNMSRDEWDDEQKINSYCQSILGSDVGIGYNFNNNITISLMHRLHYISFDKNDNTTYQPDDGRESLIGLLVNLDRANYKEDFTEGFIGRLLFERDFRSLGSDYDRTIFSWRFSYFLNPIFRHNLVFINSGAFGSNLPYGYRFRIGQGSNEYLQALRGYESDRFESDRVLLTTVEYRIPVYSFREGTISFVTFADNAILENEYQKFNLKDSRSDIGISLRIYLKRVIVPVFKIYSAYGFSNEKFLGGFSIGASF